MKRIKRTAAGIVAAGIMTMNVSSFYANAYSLPSNYNSAFEYDFFVEPISRNEVKVTFEVTNNPGASLVGIAFLYDEEVSTKKLTIFSDNLIDDNYFTFQSKPYANTQIVEISNPIFHDGDTFDCFSVSMTFEVDDSVTWHEFSVSVFDYKSETENISYNNALNNEPISADVSLQTCPYILGDVNDDSQIDISDSTATLSICSQYGDTTSEHSISVSALNNLISNGVFANDSQLSRLLCGEVADADRNGRVQVTDSSKILEHYSNSLSGLDFDSIIGNAEVKTVVI